MKRLSIFVFALLLASNASAQILYKISGNGLTKPSYIMGTYHLADGKFMQQVKPLNDVMCKVEQFCGELSLEEYQKVSEFKFDSLPGNKTLKDIYTPAEFAKINLRVREVFGFDFNSYPALLQELGRLKPGAFALLLQMQKLIGAKNVSTPLDQVLLRRGKFLNKSIIGLETAEFQLQTLTKYLYSENAKEQLLELVERWDEVFAVSFAELNHMEKAYMNQDMATLQKLLRDTKNTTVLSGMPGFYETLFNERDADWARRMPAIMRDKSTFFFVGVGHLAGNPGVLNLLRKQGFTVEPLQ